MRIGTRWRALMKHDVEPAANTMAENLEAAAHDLLCEIRDPYQKLLGGRVQALIGGGPRAPLGPVHRADIGAVVALDAGAVPTRVWDGVVDLARF